MSKNSKISNIFAFIQGYSRYHAYYSKYFKWLISKYIFEQIQYRISVMDIECYEKGSCKICGCDTTALQMANKACPKPCYPPMMSRQEWMMFKMVKDIKVKDAIELGQKTYVANELGESKMIWQNDGSHIYERK